MPDSSAPSTPVLSLSDVSLHLGGRPIVQQVSFSLERGRCLALLGPSGCGKTTLLRGLAGLAPVSAGQVRIAGRDVTSLPPQDRDVGMVFQHYALFPNLTVLDNLCFGPLARGWRADRARDRAHTLLSMVGLTDHAHQRPGQLSGGQRQRVAMARALASEPQLLLMDEPFSAIDESFRLPLRRAFRRMQLELQQGCVIVTHDRSEALELADDIAVMLDGRLAHLGTPAQLLSQPASRAVAQFLGAFNLLDDLPAGLRQAMPDAPRPPAGWAAPLQALQRDEGRALHAQWWRWQGTVTDRHPGLHHDLLSLRDNSGLSLQMIDQPGRSRIGEPLDCVLDSAALHPLPH